LEPVAGATPIGAQKADATLKPNPYIPEGTSVKQQQGQCLCVPNGKCTVPGPGAVPPPPTPNNIPPPPPINTDGAGLIDVRIVNKPPGVRCQNNFQYCCVHNNPIPKPPPPTPIQSTCGRSNIIPTPGYNLDPTQAKFGEFPWMVVIMGQSNNYVGGGVLVSPRHVVTAAHKVANFGYNLNVI